MTGRSPLRGSGLRPDGLSQSPLSQAEPLVPNASEWNYALGEQPLVNGSVLVWALGRYGDVFGPLPFEMIAPDAWEGNMLHAQHDLVAWAECAASFREVFPYQPRDPSVYGKRATAASGMEARQGGDAPCPECGGVGAFHKHPCPAFRARLHAQHDSPTAEGGDAQTLSPNSSHGEQAK